MRILLVEDDEILSDVLIKTLTDQQRYAVDLAEDGESGLSYAQMGTYDLLLIDVGLPYIDGITLCQRLRNEGSTTPILLMTAKDAVDERIRGLDAGADDYLTKPLDLSELQARIRALLRRGEVAATTILTLGPLELNPASCEVTYNSVLLKLTPKEYSLLELMLRNPARVFSRGQIIEHLWTFEDPPLEDSVKAHIKGLRRKLKKVGAANLIENVYGLGYKLNPSSLPYDTETSPSAPTQQDPNTIKAQSASSQDSSETETLEANFNQALEALWSQYQGLMAERLDILQQAVSAINGNTLSEELKQQAGQAAHKLAGVLGMFNREEGTTLARALETSLLENTGNAALNTVPQQVQQLETLLNLASASTPINTDLPNRLLLISHEKTLGDALQQLTQPQKLGWKIVDRLDQARAWIKTHTPELVIIDTAAIDIDESLTLLQDLANRTPKIPVLTLIQQDALVQRIGLAVHGAQVLPKPASAAQLWEVANNLLQTNPQSISVLAVDDDPILLDALHPLLTPWGVRLTTLDQPKRFWQVLTDSQPDLLILDVEMPDFNGIELCQAVRSDPQWQDLPIVFLTAVTDREIVQNLFESGADDYVTKPVLGPELITRITNRLERNRLLQSLSSRDSKTGLFNQPYASQVMEQWLGQSTPFAFIVLQLVDLANINLTYGHLIGHQVLQQWGTTLTAQLGDNLTISYWENGDFILGWPRLSKAEAREQLSTLLQPLRKQIFTAPDGRRIQPAYRLGVAEAPGDAKTLQQLYQLAIKTAQLS